MFLRVDDNQLGQNIASHVPREEEIVGEQRISEWVEGVAVG